MGEEVFSERWCLSRASGDKPSGRGPELGMACAVGGVRKPGAWSQDWDTGNE